MLSNYTEENENAARKAELIQRVWSMDDWTVRMVLSMVKNLDTPNDADEMEVAA